MSLGRGFHGIATFDAEGLEFWLSRAGTGLSQLLPTTQLLLPRPTRAQTVRAAHKDPKLLQDAAATLQKTSALLVSKFVRFTLMLIRPFFIDFFLGKFSMFFFPLLFHARPLFPSPLYSNRLFDALRTRRPPAAAALIPFLACGHYYRDNKSSDCL